MAINFPGPYQVRIFYAITINSVQLTHVMNLNCTLDVDPAVGTELTGINLIRRDASTETVQSAIDRWVAVLQPLYSAAEASFVNAELWKYEANSNDASYISANSINLPGTDGGTSEPAGEGIYTFRTQEGGIMRIHLEEAGIDPGTSRSRTQMTAAQGAVADFIVSSNNPWLAKDTSFPFATLALHPGSNEAVFKKRYRD